MEMRPQIEKRLKDQAAIELQRGDATIANSQSTNAWQPNS